eukprot:Colp12_sorted_trinity150504_noHs@22026
MTRTIAEIQDKISNGLYQGMENHGSEFQELMDLTPAFLEEQLRQCPHMGSLNLSTKEIAVLSLTLPSVRTGEAALPDNNDKNWDDALEALRAALSNKSDQILISQHLQAVAALGFELKNGMANYDAFLQHFKTMDRSATLAFAKSLFGASEAATEKVLFHGSRSNVILPFYLILFGIFNE